MTTRTKKTEDTEAAARAALGFVPAGKPAEDREAAARALLAVQPAAPAPEPEGKPQPEHAKHDAPAEPAPKPQPEPPAVKAAQAEPGAVEADGEGEPEAEEAEAEPLEGETFSKAAVTEIAARAYRRGAASKKVKTMEEELAQLKAELTTMKREKTVNSLAAEYGLEPELLGATKLEGAELESYAKKLAEAQPKQQEAFGFQSVRAAVNARAAQPLDAWSQLAAALR